MKLPVLKYEFVNVKYMTVDCRVYEMYSSNKVPFMMWNEHLQTVRWKVTIDIETGEIMNWPSDADDRIELYVANDFKCDLFDSQMNKLGSYSGYVPSFMSPQENGDNEYIILNMNKKKRIRGWGKRGLKNFLQVVLSDKEPDEFDSF